MASTRPFHCFTVVLSLSLPFFCGLVNAQSSVISVEPAAVTLAANAQGGATLAVAERVQLTEAVIQRIKSDKATAKLAHLFTFETDDSLPKRPSSKCRNYPGDELWPSQEVWDTFGALLGHSLIKTVPIAAPCYDSQWGPKNITKCIALVNAFGKSSTHEEDPTSNMFPIYSGRSCMARNDTTSGDKCELGGYPAYSVNVSSVAQIQLALNFARNMNLRVVIKNTGHDYLGKSSGAGSLNIWMHNLRQIDFLPNYQSKNYSGHAIKVGAGVRVEEIYRFAHAHGAAVQGGICPSVG